MHRTLRSCDERRRGIYHTHSCFDSCIDPPGHRAGPADMHIPWHQGSVWADFKPPPCTCLFLHHVSCWEKNVCPGTWGVAGGGAPAVSEPVCHLDLSVAI